MIREINGSTAFFTDSGKGDLHKEGRRICGFSSRFLVEGDMFSVDMQSGKKGILRMTEFEQMMNPSDQYFATVVFHCYADELPVGEPTPA